MLNNTILILFYMPDKLHKEGGKEELHIQQELRDGTGQRTENSKLLLAWITPILQGVIQKGIYGEL